MSAAPTQAEFREARRKYLGGSDIAAVLGLSPWKTRVQLWQDKIKPPVEEAKDNRKVKSRGHRWESVVGEMLVEELELQGYKVEIVAANKRYIDPEHSCFACEIDYELLINSNPEIVNCELKTVHPFKAKEWGESGSDELPTNYTAQAMWGLGITKRTMCIVAPLFGADEIKIFPVLRDKETLAGMRAQGLRFWNDHVVANVAPDPEEIEDMERLFSAEKGNAIEADEELTSRILRLRALSKSIKAQEAEYESVEFDIKRVMQVAPEILVQGKSAITWKERDHTFLDQEALKAEQPSIHRKFTRKSKSRVFLLKSFGWDR